MLDSLPRLRQALCAAALALPGAAAQAADDWPALSDMDLRVAGKPHDALDFGAMFEAGPAGQYGWAKALPDGHIGFEKRPSAQRFLAASMVFGGVNGGLPDHPGAEALAAELRATGYNLVRIHFIDATLMAGRTKDFDFDPDQFDRLHYLMAALKKAGIYWIVDGLTSDNAAYGDVPVNRFAKKYSAKLDVLAGDRGLGHWSTLVDKLWNTKNPYTGVAPIADPAMLGIILVNEGGLRYMATISGGRYPPAMQPAWQAWLRQRYGNDAALKAAWGSAASDADSLAGTVAMPAGVRGGDPRDVDFSRFVSAREQEAFRLMDARVRGLGFRGLTTAFDNWGFLNEDVSRAATGWVDMHSYFALPSNHGQPGSVVSQASSLANVGRYVRELTNARQWGKPFTVSEYGQVFWNQYRHEAPLLVPAVASMQGWDAICQFAETPIQFDYGKSPYVRRQAIYPYGVGGDPIARAGERLAALLFRRGDVAPARGRIHVFVDPDKALARSGGWEQLPESVSRLAFVSAIGLDFGRMPAKPPAGELDIPLTDGRPAWIGKVESALLRNGVDLGGSDDSLDALRSAGALAKANRTRTQKRVFESDTGQMLLDADAGSVSLDTPQTAALILREGDGTAGPLAIRHASAPATFALSALDGKPLAQSRHLLLWVLTDARNTGMRFDDAEATTLRAIGSWPPRVRPIAATIRLGNNVAKGLKVWPLSLAGERRAPLPLSSTAEGAELALDTAALRDGPALFYEFAAE
jgi:hypothetical protein